MSNEKNIGLESTLRGKEGEGDGGLGSRARNRTVMLTPEVTGQVRARLAQETIPHDPFAAGSARSLADVAAGGYHEEHDNAGVESMELNPSGNPHGGGDDRGGFYGSQHAGSQFGSGSPGFGGGSTPAARQASRAPAGPQIAPPLSQPVRSTAPRSGGIVWTKESLLIGFLVSYDNNPNGEFYDVRVGRIMITSQGGDPNSLIIDDETVSPMHAVMRISPEGEIQVLDQLSEYGTKIKRGGSEEEEQLSGEKSSVGHGDVIAFGNRTFHVCLIDRGIG